MILGKDLVPLAERAVTTVVRALEKDPDPLTFLHRSRHISFHLPELDSVARVRPLNGAEALESLQRELDIVTYLTDRGAPVVPPSPHFVPQPHMANGFAMTFWPFIKHEVFDEDRLGHLDSALESLQHLHAAFRDYPGDLPSYRHQIDECAAMLDRDDGLPALAPEDRAFLAAIRRHLISRLNAFDIKAQPIHGDAHPGNVFMTADGPLWSDLEAASLGPVEWDLSGLPGAIGDTPENGSLAALMTNLRSFCVSVWCWDLAHMPEKLEAAQYHTERLKARYKDVI